MAKGEDLPKIKLRLVATPTGKLVLMAGTNVIAGVEKMDISQNDEQRPRGSVRVMAVLTADVQPSEDPGPPRDPGLTKG